MEIRLLNKATNAYDSISAKKFYKALSRGDDVNDVIVIDGIQYEFNSVQEDKFLIKGTIANADTNPNYPVGKKGDIYQITTIAGKVGGAAGKDVDINDFIVCLADAAAGAEAAVGTSWGSFERNIDLSTLVTGDITVTDAGVSTIGAVKVTAAKTALADGKVLIGGAAGAAAEQTLSGDVTVTNAGVSSIGATKVIEAKISASLDIGLGVLRVARAKYNFATEGGVIGTITPALNATIPDNAIIVGGCINSTTAATSGGAATIAVGTSAGSSTTSIIGVTAVASYSADARLNSVATFAAPVKMTAAGSVTITVATADLTAGVIEVTLLYFVAAA